MLKQSILCSILAAIVLAIDLSIPLGVAGGVPYIVVVLASLRGTSTPFTIAVAVICSLLTGVGYLYSPAGGEEWKVVFNRGLALFAIWTTAILAIRWKKSIEENMALELKMKKEKEAIYLATIHGAQHILNNLLNQLQYIRLEVENHEDFNREVIAVYDDIVDEASSLITKLSSVSELSESNIKKSVAPE